ncbi:hypothetical protein ACJX0J_024161 [Zea mays]
MGKMGMWWSAYPLSNQRIGYLDKKAETAQLPPNELTLKIYIDERLATILREEEIRDNNTKYFHLEDNDGTRIEEIIGPFACLMLTRLLIPRKLLLCLTIHEIHRKKMNGVKCQLSLEDMWGLKRLVAWGTFLLNQDGTWQQLLKNKYLGSKSLTQAVRKSGDSHFWAGLMNIKEEFLRKALVKDLSIMNFLFDIYLFLPMYMFLLLAFMFHVLGSSLSLRGDLHRLLQSFTSSIFYVYFKVHAIYNARYGKEMRDYIKSQLHILARL